MGYVILKIAIFGNYPYNTIILDMLSMKKEGALLKNVKKISRDAAGRIPRILQIFIKF